MATADRTGKLSCQDFLRPEREGLPSIHFERSPEPAGLEPADKTYSQLLASLSEAVALLQPAQDEIERLRTQVREAIEKHRLVAAELEAVKTRLAGAGGHLNHGPTDRTDIERQALREEILRQEKRRQRSWWRFLNGRTRAIKTSLDI